MLLKYILPQYNGADYTGRKVYNFSTGGSSSPAPAPSSQTVTQTAIPEYARPYVEQMLGQSQALTQTPYQTYGGQRIAEFSPLQQQAFQNVAGMQVAPEVGQAAGLAGTAGLGALGTAGRMADVGGQYARQFTDPYATQAYMSPYIQSALAPQLAEIQRQSDITQQGLRGQAVQAGAFGGSRQALQAAEAERNKQMLMAQTVGQGYQNAFQAAQQAQQYGANLGLQGLQGALSGLSTAGQLAGTLGQLGQTGFGQQQAINAAQQQVGAVQQAQAQQQMDLAYQDFLKQRNYPYQQLAFMSDMLRGLPLSQAAQQVYTAPPSAVAQLGGLGMAGLGAYGAMGGFKAKGGVIKAAGGGLMEAKYAVGGNIDSMSEDQLTKLLDSPNLTPMEQMQIEDRLMLMRRMEMNPESSRIMSGGVSAIPTGSMVPQNYGMAGGGIIAFNGDTTSSVTDDDDEDQNDDDDLVYENLDTTKAPTGGLPPSDIQTYIDAASKSAMARRNIPLSPEEVAYRERLRSTPERAKEKQMAALSGLLMRIGAGAAKSKSQYPGVAFGEGAAEGTPEFLKEIGKIGESEDTAIKELAGLGRLERAEKLAGVAAGEKVGLGAATLASREAIAAQRRASMERIAEAKKTDFQRKWALYVEDAKKRNVTPDIKEFQRMFPDAKSNAFLSAVIKGNPTGTPDEWFQQSQHLERLSQVAPNWSPKQRAAYEWLTDPKNKNDPRAPEIRRSLGL